MSIDNETLSINSGLIIAVDVPFWTLPGFVIPLVQTEMNSNAFYIQRTSAKGRVISFESVIPSSRIRKLSVANHVQIGDNELFGIIDMRGEIRVCGKHAMRSFVAPWIHDVPSSLTKVSLAFFIENLQIVRDVSQDLMSVKEAEFNSKEEACRWIVNAVFLDRLIQSLGTFPKTDTEEPISDRDLYARIHLESDIVSISLPEFVLDKKRRNNRRYNKGLAGNLELIHSVLNRKINLLTYRQDINEPKNFIFSQEIVRGYVELLMQHANQEDRVALIIATLLRDPPNGYHLLFVYRDRAEFANYIVETLKYAISPHQNGSQISAKVAGMIQIFVNRAYPMQRGKLLMSLSKQLGSYKDIADAINKIVKISKSTNVMGYKESIKRNIAGRHGL